MFNPDVFMREELPNALRAAGLAELSMRAHCNHTWVFWPHPEGGIYINLPYAEAVFKNDHDRIIVDVCVDGQWYQYDDDMTLEEYLEILGL